MCCCELLPLTWPSMPASPPGPQKPGLLDQGCGPGVHLSAITWPCPTPFGTRRGCGWAFVVLGQELCALQGQRLLPWTVGDCPWPPACAHGVL